jgi:hypothetical protein
MIKTVPWMESPAADKIRESIASYDSATRVVRAATPTTTAAPVAASVPAADNPWLNGATVQPLEGDGDR